MQVQCARYLAQRGTHILVDVYAEAHLDSHQTSPIIGIAFSLVIVRVSLGMGSNGTSTIARHHGVRSLGANITQASTSPLAMHIRHQTETIRVVDGDSSVGDVTSIGEKSEPVV